MFKKILKFLLLFLVLFFLAFILGPKVDTPYLDRSQPEITSNLAALEAEINRHEAAIPNIKPENEARIVWADSTGKKTAYSIVYLHGWSASQKEGDPLHMETAKRYGFNLYLPRLSGHGLIEDEPMLTITADKLLNSAKEAIAVGKQLGDKVILMATSTGGTLALYLSGGDPDIAGMLLYSPNIEIFDTNARLLTQPWGVQLAKWVKGGDYHEFEKPTEEDLKYWTSKYRVEALSQLQVLMESTMTEETFQNVRQPVFLGYYYKDEIHQDSTVSVPAMLRMFDELGTPKVQKRKVAFPNVGAHVITSSITSKDLESVERETNSFLEGVLGLKPL
ncbi:MAG: alpha/beta hydrolase [Robiginitalea sp.]|uniref:alpha/beta hydrolase n=1 Tax=Robiginitalea sp. TaxID=1902411 RepID=UPI003C737195